MTNFQRMISAYRYGIINKYKTLRKDYWDLSDMFHKQLEETNRLREELMLAKGFKKSELPF